MLTKSKEQIAAEACEAAREAMRSHQAMGAYGYSISQSSVMGMLNDMYAKAIEAAVYSALKNMYTNDDFNKDIGL